MIEQPWIKIVEMQALPFDSRHLKRECHLIHIPDTVDLTAVATQTETIFRSMPKKSFITIKASAGRTDIMNTLARQGADLIDIEIRFVFSDTGECQAAMPDDLLIAFHKKADPAPFIGLADDLKWSRLYQDHRLPIHLVRELWQESIQNHLNGLSDLVAIALKETVPAGFAAIKQDGDSHSIFIVGVLEEYRVNGVGTCIAHTVGQHGLPAKVTVDTSIKNKAARKAYEKAGFVATDYTAIFHYHAK